MLLAFLIGNHPESSQHTLTKATLPKQSREREREQSHILGPKEREEMPQDLLMPFLANIKHGLYGKDFPTA
jgi:hypothetical protein